MCSIQKKTAHAVTNCGRHDQVVPLTHGMCTIAQFASRWPRYLGQSNYSTNQHQLAGISTYAIAQPLAQLTDNPYGAGFKSYFIHFPLFFALLYLHC